MRLLPTASPVACTNEIADERVVAAAARDDDVDFRALGTCGVEAESRRTAAFRCVPLRSAESGHDLGHGGSGA